MMIRYMSPSTVGSLRESGFDMPLFLFFSALLCTFIERFVYKRIHFLNNWVMSLPYIILMWLHCDFQKGVQFIFSIRYSSIGILCLTTKKLTQIGKNVYVLFVSKSQKMWGSYQKNKEVNLMSMYSVDLDYLIFVSLQGYVVCVGFYWISMTMMIPQESYLNFMITVQSFHLGTLQEPVMVTVVVQSANCVQKGHMNETGKMAISLPKKTRKKYQQTLSYAHLVCHQLRKVSSIHAQKQPFTTMS